MYNVYLEYWWQFLITCIVSYFVGATNFAVLLSRLFKSQDVRKYGSGNAGSTNMFRVYGLPLAILTFVCDALKSVVCIFLSKWIFANSFDEQALMQLTYLAALFAVVGHVLPVYFKFRGGKGVAPTVGCVFSLHPILALCLVLPLLLIILITDRNSLASLTLSVFMLVWIWVAFLPTADIVCAIAFTLIFLLVLFAHRGNIARLLKGQEKRTGIVKAFRKIFKK